MKMGRALLVMLACALPLAGCSDSMQPVAAPKASGTPIPPAVPPRTGPPTTPTVPSPTATSVIYNGPSNLYDAYISYHGGSLASRYVLYSDSTFALEFVSPRFGSFSYFGRYARVDSRLVFAWDGWSTAGPWASEATLRGDSLSVVYNSVMMLSDFVDGTYVRSPATTP